MGTCDDSSLLRPGVRPTDYAVGPMTATMPTALITGVAGQDGMYLARLLLANGWRVVGTVRPGISSIARMAPYLEGVEIVDHELTDSLRFDELLSRFAPEAVYNLAAFSSVGRSWTD